MPHYGKMSHKLLLQNSSCKSIEDIFFFELNTKFISSSVLKTSEFSRVRRTSENSDVFNSRAETYLVFTEKSKFSFYFILFRRFTGDAENAKTKFFSTPE